MYTEAVNKKVLKMKPIFGSSLLQLQRNVVSTLPPLFFLLLSGSGNIILHQSCCKIAQSNFISNKSVNHFKASDGPRRYNLTPPVKRNELMP
jgi:hypothetical protein